MKLFSCLSASEKSLVMLYHNRVYFNAFDNKCFVCLLV
jgi:hypothetical protein